MVNLSDRLKALSDEDFETIKKMVASAEAKDRPKLTLNLVAETRLPSATPWRDLRLKGSRFFGQGE